MMTTQTLEAIPEACYFRCSKNKASNSKKPMPCRFWQKAS